jgi:hypothetical protein
MDLSTSAKRVPSARWFQLIGVVNQNPAYVIKLGTDGTFTAAESGRLWAFANDAESFYFNNSGVVELHIHENGIDHATDADFSNPRRKYLGREIRDRR